MKIYLDTKDLINILQGGNPCAADQFEESLQKGGHWLVASLYTIIEMSVPLTGSYLRTNVMALLNRIEKMPITFARSDIDYLELKEALEAFSSRRECKQVFPFVDRFDRAVDSNTRTGDSTGYSLAGTVWDLNSHRALQGLENYAQKMRQLVAEDRKLRNPQALKANFMKTIERNLRLFNISTSGVSLLDFASWVYENPSRCPAIRLGYEVWHQIVKNKTDRLKDSDMEDYQHLTCLPYADFMTLDARMHNYVSQVSASIGLDYRGRIFRSVQDVLGRL